MRPLNPLQAHHWTGAVLRSVSYDLDTRTLVIEVHPESLDSGLCRRAVVTNCDCTINGQIMFGDVASRRMIREPVDAPELAVVGITNPISGFGQETSVFATSTGSIVAVGGIASIDELVLPENERPLGPEDYAVLDDWLNAA